MSRFTGIPQAADALASVKTTASARDALAALVGITVALVGVTRNADGYVTHFTVMREDGATATLAGTRITRRQAGTLEERGLLPVLITPSEHTSREGRQYITLH